MCLQLTHTRKLSTGLISATNYSTVSVKGAYLAQRVECVLLSKGGYGCFEMNTLVLKLFFNQQFILET